MHKIFMFVNYTPKDKSIGITKKISAEIDAFRKLGHEVYYSAYEDEGIGVFDNNNNLIFEKAYPVKNERIVSKIRFFCLTNALNQFMSKTDTKFDLCYGRLSATDKNYMKLLRTMKKRGMRIILESHGYFPGVKFKSLTGKYIIYSIEKRESELPKLVDYFVSEGDFDTLFGVPAKPTRIGVNVDAIMPHQYVGEKEELNLVSVANETDYHAYDRIIKSVAEYLAKGGKRKVTVHLIGVVTDKTKDLIHSLSVENNVILYGKQYGEGLDRIYNNCNMGIGPLGQHRIGGKKDTGLKTKEYFAKGLPYFYSGNELPELRNCPYIYEVPSDESLIDIDRLWDFYATYKDADAVVDSMRKIAQENFSWTSILSNALSYLD